MQAVSGRWALPPHRTSNRSSIDQELCSRFPAMPYFSFQLLGLSRWTPEVSQAEYRVSHLWPSTFCVSKARMCACVRSKGGEARSCCSSPASKASCSAKRSPPKARSCSPKPASSALRDRVEATRQLLSEREKPQLAEDDRTRILSGREPHASRRRLDLVRRARPTLSIVCEPCGRSRRYNVWNGSWLSRTRFINCRGLPDQPPYPRPRLKSCASASISRRTRTA